MFAAALVACVIAGADTHLAAATTFSVNPTQIFLSGRAVSALLTLRNDSTETLRFQLSVFTWTQSAAGEMRLEPTQDIVFFPPLLTLQPEEERRVRIGSSTITSTREKTYRIFVEELPPLERTSTGAGAVRVLTKMGIPVFLRPPQEISSAALNGLRLDHGHVRFTLSNTGTVHAVPRTIRVRGLAGGDALLDGRLEGWYVLAGGRRDFDMAVPSSECARVTSLIVDVELGFTTLQERLQTPAGACAP